MFCMFFVGSLVSFLNAKVRNSQDGGVGELPAASGSMSSWGVYVGAGGFQCI